MTKKFLTGAYDLKNQQETKNLYVEWAESYDQEVNENGYASPRRTAEALAACGADTKTPVLDIGCGSGISGEFLSAAGFTDIHGSDFSPEMLALAKNKGIYQALHLADFNSPFAFIESPFEIITAVGVFSVGHAKPDLMQTVIELLPTSGLFAFSLNDHALEDPGYLNWVQRSVLDNRVRVRWQDYGEHLPGLGLQSMIMVIEKL